jgi:hypothetical protein
MCIYRGQKCSNTQNMKVATDARTIRVKDTLMLLKNILEEPRNKLSIILGDSMNLRELLTPFAAFLEGLLTQN